MKGFRAVPPPSGSAARILRVLTEWGGKKEAESSDLNDFRAFGHVFKAYRETAGRSYVPLTLANTPAEKTVGLPLMPPQTGLPVLDGIAAKAGPGTPGGWVFPINRSLTADLTASVVLNDLPAGVSTIVVDQLTASSCTARNIPGTNPMAVQFTSLRTARLPAQSAVGFTLTVPKHTLMRIKLL